MINILSNFCIVYLKVDYVFREKSGHFQTQVEYLSHCIDANGIHPTEKKIKAVEAAPTATDASPLPAFIGLMNYYRKFIPHIVTHLAPL